MINTAKMGGGRVVKEETKSRVLVAGTLNMSIITINVNRLNLHYLKKKSNDLK